MLVPIPIIGFLKKYSFEILNAKALCKLLYESTSLRIPVCKVKSILRPSVILSKLISILAMYSLSIVMKTIPMGITYASFAGLCIIATTLVGMYKFNQIPDLYTLIGLVLIIAGVLIVNLLGKAN